MSPPKITAGESDGSGPKRRFEEFKFLVQPVFLLTEDGKTIGETAADPVTVYSLRALRAFVDAFPAELERVNQEHNS